MGMIHKNHGVGNHTADHIEVNNASLFHFPLKSLTWKVLIGQFFRQFDGPVGTVLTQNYIHLFPVLVCGVVGNQVQDRLQRHTAGYSTRVGRVITPIETTITPT